MCAVKQAGVVTIGDQPCQLPEGLAPRDPRHSQPVISHAQQQGRTAGVPHRLDIQGTYLAVSQAALGSRYVSLDGIGYAISIVQNVWFPVTLADGIGSASGSGLAEYVMASWPMMAARRPRAVQCSPVQRSAVTPC